MKNELPPVNSASSFISNISSMAAIDMPILKIHIKMHLTSFFFFSHPKKYKTCHCGMLRVLSKGLVYQSQMFFRVLLKGLVYQSQMFFQSLLTIL